MEEFTYELLRQLPEALLAGLLLAGEFKGILAEEALKLVFLPLYEFSFTSCIVSLGWIAIFWKNKGLLLGGLDRFFNIADWLGGLIKGTLLWLKT